MFFNISIQFAAQAMRRREIGWKPAQYLNNVSASVATVMKPAGFDNVQGVLTAISYGSDRQTVDRPPRHEDVGGMDGQAQRRGSLSDASNVYAYSVSFLARDPEECGDN